MLERPNFQWKGKREWTDVYSTTFVMFWVTLASRLRLLHEGLIQFGRPLNARSRLLPS